MCGRVSKIYNSNQPFTPSATRLFHKVILHSGYTALCSEEGPFDWNAHCKRSLYDEYKVHLRHKGSCMQNPRGLSIAGDWRGYGRVGHAPVEAELLRNREGGSTRKVLLGMDHRDWASYYSRIQPLVSNQTLAELEPDEAVRRTLRLLSLNCDLAGDGDADRGARTNSLIDEALSRQNYASAGPKDKWIRVVEDATIKRGLANDARLFAELGYSPYIYHLPYAEWVSSSGQSVAVEKATPNPFHTHPAMSVSAAELIHMPEYLYTDPESM